MNITKTVGQKVEGSRIDEPRGPKSGGWLGPSGQIVYAYAGLPLFKQCEIPDNSMTFP